MFSNGAGQPELIGLRVHDSCDDGVGAMRLVWVTVALMAHSVDGQPSRRQVDGRMHNAAY